MSIENGVRLIGHLGADVEVKWTQGGVAVGTTRMATTRRFKKDGERKEETSWHRVKFFGTLAEVAGEHLRKGSKLAIEGSIRYGEYEKDGVKHYTTDIIADQMTFLDSKPADDRPQRSERPTRQERPPQRQANRSAGAPMARREAPVDEEEDFDDSDIPM